MSFQNASLKTTVAWMVGAACVVLLIRVEARPAGYSDATSAGHPMVSRDGARRGVACFLFGCLLVVEPSLSGDNDRLSFPASAALFPRARKQDEELVTAIAAGSSIQRRFARNEKHSYRLTLAGDVRVELRIEQQGAELSIVVLDPDGHLLLKTINQTSSHESRIVTFITPVAGDYRLELRPAARDVTSGAYTMAVGVARPPLADERKLEEARVLMMRSAALVRQGQYDDALSPIARALDLRESILGLEHPLVADSLHALADVYDNKGRYKDAEPLNLRALTIREKALGADHQDVAESLGNLGVLFYQKGDYALAESYLRRALVTFEKALGPGHPSVAATVGSLGKMYVDRGEYDKAESAFQRALEIQERTLGPDDLVIGSTVSNLGTLNYYRGDYTTAESLYRRAVPIWEKEFGPEHPNVGKTLHNLAAIFDRIGDYPQAEPLYQRAVAIWEKALGPDHPMVAAALNNLADLYGKKGDHAKAEPLFWRALAIREKALGPNHPDVAWTLSHLGQALAKHGDYAQAAALHQRALAIQEQTLGPNHTDVADSLRKLAGLFAGERKYAEAEPLYRRAAAILEKALGPNHPDVAQALNNLADLHRKRADYAHAEPLYRRALEIGERSVGAAHPDVAVSLGGLAALFRATGDVQQSLTFLTRYVDLSERNLARNLPLGSERQKVSYLQLFSRDTDNALSLHLLAAPPSAAALHLAFSTLLRRKGRGLDAMTNNVAALRSRADPGDQALFGQLSDARSQLATLTLRGPEKDPAAFQPQLTRLEERVDALEAEISLRSAQFRSQSRPITLEAIQSAIPGGTTLVEFALYRPGEANSETGNHARYAAYVLAPEGPPRWVDLGEASPIDEAIEAWRTSLRDPARKDVMRLGRAVDGKVMQPVRALLGPARHLLISPDGALNLVPFAALIDEHGKYLIEAYTITYLTSGRDLLRLQVARASRSAPVIVADPALGEPALIASSAAAGRTQGVQTNGSRLDYSQVFFGPLPGASAEAQALKQLLPEASLLTRDQATKRALQQVRGPSILHIATHGFFLQDDERITHADGVSEDTRLGKWVAHVENPLLRSGLALAGANAGASGATDGVLTAMEATDLDLWGTQLVVLSACDTGVGEIRNGEGVYGLRRALVLAGSESQMMTLWPVSDRGTRDLIVGYYVALLRGAGRGEALRVIQIKMLHAASHSHPYYWASFILSGQWAHLDREP